MTPLLRAIIDDVEFDWNDRSLIDRYMGIKDPLGFTPFELAQLFGKYSLVKKLGGNSHSFFKVKPKGVQCFLQFSLRELEEFFHFSYQQYLAFSSYNALKQAVNNCPFLLRSSILAYDNHEGTKKYRKELAEGSLAPTYIKWIDDRLNYGLFALEDLYVGTFIGEYTGRVRQLSRFNPDQNGYCFHYPTKFWSWKYLIIDSLKEGNVTRFINHSLNANIEPLCVVDRGLLHQIFVASCPIKAGDQLVFNYGKDYWRKRKEYEV